MAKLIDLTGKKFGKLTVVCRAPDYITPKGQHKTQWYCKCSCEDQKLIVVMATHLKTGHTKSCGCVHDENLQRIHKNKKKYNKYDLSGEYGVGWTTNTNEEFFFDLEDYDKIKDYAWMSHKTKEGCMYIASTSDHIYMHRLIMDCPEELVVDHKYHNTFDNRKNNLRISTVSENIVNSERCYQAGVLITQSGKYSATIKFNNDRKYLGIFDSKEEALNARTSMEKELFKQYRYDPTNGDEVIFPAH